MLAFICELKPPHPEPQIAGRILKSGAVSFAKEAKDGQDLEGGDE